jgi:hypothetical protein
MGDLIYLKNYAENRSMQEKGKSGKMANLSFFFKRFYKFANSPLFGIMQKSLKVAKWRICHFSLRDFTNSPIRHFLIPFYSKHSNGSSIHASMHACIKVSFAATLEKSLHSLCSGSK